MTAPVVDPPPRETLPPLASWGARALAWVLDMLVIVLASSAILLGFVVVLVPGLDPGDLDRVLSAGLIPVALAAAGAYFPLLMRRAGERNGQTWGKELARIRVVRLDGEPVTAGTALWRDSVSKYGVFTVFAVIALYIPTLVNFLWPLFDKHNQAPHDKVAGTLVVRGDLPYSSSP